MKIKYVVFYQMWRRRTGPDPKFHARGFSSRTAALAWMAAVPSNLCNINLYRIEELYKP
jgi:hypothetical protein